MTGNGTNWAAGLPCYWAKYLTPGQARFASMRIREPGDDNPVRCQAPECREPITCTTWERRDRPGKPVWGGRYFCSPHGEEWAAGHGIRMTAADPRYSVFSMTPDYREDAARHDEPCESNGCAKPATHITYTQDASRKRPLESELFRCTQHAEEYARRHHVEIRPHIERGPR